MGHCEFEIPSEQKTTCLERLPILRAAYLQHLGDAEMRVVGKNVAGLEDAGGLLGVAVAQVTPNA